MKRNSIILIIFLSACSLFQNNQQLHIAPAIVHETGDLASLNKALDLNIKHYRNLDLTKEFELAGETYTNEDVYFSLVELKKAIMRYGNSSELYEYLEHNFIAIKPKEPSLLTGYYEPKILASKHRTASYRFPVYETPDDLYVLDTSNLGYSDLPERLVLKADPKTKKLSPYYSRNEIDYQEKLKNRKLEIAWVKDPIDLFFLQIQGSGVLVFKDQTEVRIAYAEQNGYPYRAIGKYMIEQGYLKREQVSMQSIKAFLKKNPDKLEEILSSNPSYVFFRKNPKDAPIGSMGVKLTAYRSIATDRKIYPAGLPVFLKTKLPVFDQDGAIKTFKEVSLLTFNQDTGGAIKGAARADFFCGNGETAALVAGHLKTEADLSFLMLKK